jgi:hypothetical protein
MLIGSFLLQSKVMFHGYAYPSDDWLYGWHFPFGHRTQIVAEVLSWYQAEDFPTSQFISLLRLT